MTTIKSVAAVRAHGNGNNGNRVARVRLVTGEEFFAGINSGCNLAQVEALIRNSRLAAGKFLKTQ